ncbi:MAG: DEAD/DEAH box helicase family protein [Methanobrevibacter sp.]|uniref:DEAD/DEAH box helicase family protein n=1 Tax=Methanobrevibacter sp. TaxID=66852 RepID=UPI0026E0C76A|nr:DEAD/DEAH box helicase family protein [Methanobrevibacter sp.]MDO5849074.1 DEAD/DEAH box helicase family protein [Methanobrevibacter sp.]
MAKSKGFGSNPLLMAKFLTEEVNKAWEDGSFYENVTPVTQDLLRFWFSDVFCDTRDINFHDGQKQAILNIIYLHEILKVKNVKDLYLSTDPELLQKMDIGHIEKDKFQHPMYGVKMATGTGKTWVLNAILIWQYLNAREYDSELFSKNFLLIAPGVIVYNRLLDAFLGKENEEGSRVFETSDFFKFKEVFIPEAYESIFFGFLQTAVAKKEEIGSKVTGDGLIAITNWHLLIDKEEDLEYDSPLDDPHKVFKKLLPVFPRNSEGNLLDVLDNNFLKGKALDYLASLEDIVVFNDEAHHIHEFKSKDGIKDAEWQKSLDIIAEEKKDKFIRIDFSATLYSNSTGKNKQKHYFPHVVVDFTLKEAIRQGLVKLIAIDKRKEVSSISLDFKAEREGNKVIGLSKGQKLMLRAGLSKLKILEKQFDNFEETFDGLDDKDPKMLVVCEDTSVTPFVKNFLLGEGLAEEDILEIHSKRGEISENEWGNIRQKLFNLDKYKHPKVVISVLMLREGFDVNNICVIVPLRSTESSILLEQTIGRGLRLMWREPEFHDIKLENRIRLLNEKKEPNNYFDLLSIVEHPKFIDFYNTFIEEGIVTEINDEINAGKVLGDMINVPLRDDYENFDFYWPAIISEREEFLTRKELSFDKMDSFQTPLKDLQLIRGEKGEIFESQELTVHTRFGRYRIISDLFDANSYNEFLARLINHITKMLQPIKRTQKEFPIIQINHDELARVIDDYIRIKLFDEPFNPMVDENWRILFMGNESIVNHIVLQITKVLYNMQHDVNVKEAEIKKYYFSNVPKLRMRENYSLDVSKSIYEKLPYPSNKGGFEKRFIESVDRDSNVDSFIKINEYYHNFANIMYIREDGLLARYFPDFLVKINEKIYVVETKSDKDMSTINVQSKRVSTLNFLDNLNQISQDKDLETKWEYVLLGENTFDSMYNNGASIEEILNFAIVTSDLARGFATLDSFK